MTTRDDDLARWQAEAAAVPADVLAHRHAKKLETMAQLREQARAARAALADAPAALPAGPVRDWSARRVLGLITNPMRLGRAVERHTRTGRHTVASIPQIVRREGGARPAARKALGLALRDGPGGVRVLVPPPVLRAPAPQPTPAPITPAWYDDQAPEVSVVVLNWNRSDVTLECLHSLWEHTAGHRYEIVLVDNGSRDSDRACFASLPGPCRTVLLDINRYFGEGNNIGVDRAKAPLVVLMNNDVTVTPGWLEPLVSTLQDSPGCGLVGPKFIYPNGLLQEAGGLLDENAHSVQVGKYQDPTLPEFNQSGPVDYVSAACCLFRKEDFERVLGFDMRYEPAYYEDADLCLKLNQLGLSVVYVSESTVVHHESVTTSDTSHGLELNNISELNRMKFLGRWGDYLRTGRHESAPARSPLIQCSIQDDRPTVGLYTPFELTPGGGERYLLTVAMEALAHGRQVHLVTPAPYSRVRLTALAAMFGLDLDGLCLTPLDEAERRGPFDEWIALSNQLVPPVRSMGLRNTLLCQFPFRSGVEQWRARLHWLAEYQRIAVYSPFTADAVRARLAEANVAPVPITVLTPPVDLAADPIRPGKAGIVSVGRFFSGDHSKRQDLQIEAFRHLVESGRADGVTLHLVGSSATRPIHRQFLIDCIDAAEGLAVQFHVDAPLSEVTELYAASSIYWHSSGLGVDPTVEPERCEHFGIAPIEAMAHGTIPVVVNNGGPAATVRDGIDGYHYDSVEGLAARTAELLSRTEDELRPMREMARSRAQQFSREAFGEALASTFDW